ncbi:CLUMA_CG006566, isoform A [Clunio marinus]|uniref:CLUMA_CG006566, isoform A n=1 Tax=Clunio marinus TaxID=568069 RepID=A0A1J1I3T1_9DIPT|nr:CLUMA_CG006566, isoform A [Clunio marinus]
MFKSRSWFGLTQRGPKNRLSLENLKILYGVLEKNQNVSEQNRELLVESLRCIAEILIWGDQNDGSVFDFFLEKNMLSYFLCIMRQKSGGSSYVCVQLLQTLNILFENIRNETSLYYLLSNNHVNSIIVHKFDFSDEDVMGYYILFLKTLSLKLNPHTIHFFYNEHTNDFPLYTEAIKFFNHPESMVRIAVRTISLNVYKVENESMQQFIRDRTAAPYFSNLVWFIGKHILELDACVRNDTDHQSQNRLSNLVAEHLDHLHYLNDILLLKIDGLNAVLTEHLLHKLFVPLFVYSLTPPTPVSMAVVTRNLAAVLNKIVDIDEDVQDSSNPRVSSVVALFLLSLVFLVITHSPLVHALAWVLLNGDHSVFKDGASEILNNYVDRREKVTLGFGEPSESLEEALDGSISNISPSASGNYNNETSTSSSSSPRTNQHLDSGGRVSSDGSLSEEMEKVNITDEEKEQILESSLNVQKSNRPFLDMILQSLECSENDYLTLLALCLLYALANNKGVNSDWLDLVLNKSSSSVATKYNGVLMEKLLSIIHTSSQPSCRVRLVTIELTLKLLLQLFRLNPLQIQEIQKSSLLQARSQSMTVLKNFYKSEDIFLDLFEDEYNEMMKSNINVEFLCMDSTILLPPTGTPLTGIEFSRRLPCGEVEKARRAIRFFFLIRKMCQSINDEVEQLLPLTNQSQCVQIENALDLNNSDLIACTVIMKDTTKYRRFLVIDILQLILVEPDPRKLGWGIAKFVGLLQDVEVAGDKDDSRCLHITIHRGTTNRTPILSAKFIFDDHIRCMAAKQRLTKGRTKARQKKMYQIAQLLEIPQLNDSPTPIYNSMLRESRTARTPREHRPLFSTVQHRPGVASALRRESMPSGSVSRCQIVNNRSDGESSRRRSSSKTSLPINTPSGSKNRSHSGTPKSRESSPRMHREEIPLEHLNSSPSSRCSSNSASRSQTPSRLITDLNIGMSVAKEGTSQTNGEFTIESSEETSFIAAERKKGTIETV